MSRRARSFHLSLETVIATSSLLGHPLEDRSEIRLQQDAELLQEFQSASTQKLRDDSQRSLFSVAPLDILVSRNGSGPRFHFIEMNGTGIGGLTNLTVDAVTAVLAGLEETARAEFDPEGVVLIASSGRECDQKPRLNRMMHEKLLFADAIKRGMQARSRPVDVYALEQLACTHYRGEASGSRGDFEADSPILARQRGGRGAIVVGYIPQFLNHLTLEDDGRLSLFGRIVTGMINDRFCLNVFNQFGGRIDLEQVSTVNRCFVAGGDKGIAYDLMNDCLADAADPRLPEKILFERADHRDELISRIFHWREQGRQAVIKPQGTGMGHGIEFFLDPQEPADTVIHRIDRSIQTTERYYRVAGGAFPYTIGEFVDTCMLEAAGHPLRGHKYELRVVVYRDGSDIKAFPSIVKIAGRAFDATDAQPDSLINNITASSVQHQRSGTEYMLPLTNHRTLSLLDLKVEDLTALCRLTTRYVRHVLDTTQDDPQRLWLPPSNHSQPPILPLTGRKAA